ncbi:hypothetical protein BV22DRAFT_1002963 [Leucogyrophana mollusca]|uniref:Uncharacterized protein n=1 Tax=Leucogyrophana mollusca TaxID=85980 RepID=A0ACB8BVF2_9AGAM|nr:hypothetical protein BV22DRAFT_1002963 [Leucogyrophana mollusca]
MEKTVGTLALAPTPTSISIPQSLSIAKLATERSKKPLPRRRRSGITKKSKPSQKRIIRAPAPPQPVPQTALIKIEEAPSPALATPELSYPDTIDDFVPTVDIPPLDLDGGNQKVHEYDYSILPRSTAPAYGGTYFGVKPEAHEFVDGYMLGMFGDEFDHTLIPPMPALSYESSSSGSESGTPPVTPPIDYANFTNPFKSSSVPDTRHSFLSGLDQLFAQSLSPMTVPRPSPNLAFEEYIPEELDLSAWLNYD